jgi:hypothetical protein
MRDLTDPRWIKVKGILFLVLGTVSATLLWMQSPTWRSAALLGIVIWSFCRFYYFAFYVIEKYVDPNFRFSGLGDFARYLWRSRRDTDG